MGADYTNVSKENALLSANDSEAPKVDVSRLKNSTGAIPDKTRVFERSADAASRPSTPQDNQRLGSFRNDHSIENPVTTTERKRKAGSRDAPDRSSQSSHDRNSDRLAPEDAVDMMELPQEPPVDQDTKTIGPRTRVPDPSSLMLKEPETRPITQDQLVNEVRGIYAGLVMVEKKCVEICQQQSKNTNKLSNEQWQALIALHRTLLHEHHDFFLASQHPTASPALQRLATKYAMPARMWRHGIHSFLELLRHRLPDSLDHMLAFVYLSYSMMALLLESVPAFVETWIECLGDLARYRMAIEEVDPRDREIWSNVARMWYNKAADRSPGVGRIQHHLAVLARPDIVLQLFYYSKSLTSVVSFPNARESVMLLFTPFMDKSEIHHKKYPPIEPALVAAFGILFTRGSIADFGTYAGRFISGVDSHIVRISTKWKAQGPEIASALISGLLDFGQEQNFIWNSIRAREEEIKKAETLESNAKGDYRKTFWNDFDSQAQDFTKAMTPTNDNASEAKFSSSNEVLAHVLPIWSKCTSVVALRLGDKNILPYIHVTLAFIWSLSHVPNALLYMEEYVPWVTLVTFLNTLGRSGLLDASIESEDFPQSLSGTGRHLPEDFAMRGSIWSQFYFPSDFFSGQIVDEDERALELPSHGPPRTERCLWLGVRLSSLGRYIDYNVKSKKFSATEFALSLPDYAPEQSESKPPTTFGDLIQDHEMVDAD